MKNKKNTNCAQLKQVSIVEYLQANGIAFVKETRENYWFPSPFRKETKPSFGVMKRKNYFNDFGSGARGDIITLVKLLHQTDTAGALRILAEFIQNNPQTPFFSFSPAPLIETYKKQGITFAKIQNPILRKYLANRGISYRVYDDVPELGQVYQYPNGIDTLPAYFNIGFKNDSGGYELRNREFKGCIAPKDITTVPGFENNLLLFEGFMDYLSALHYFNTTWFRSTAIILNTLSHLDRVLPILKKYEKVFLFLDNDEAGYQATLKVLKHNSHAQNMALKYYPEHKDFNEMLMSLDYSQSLRLTMRGNPRNPKPEEFLTKK
jgi:DNA primase